MHYLHDVHGQAGKIMSLDERLKWRIPVASCKSRRLYRLDTRNLGPIAVFDTELNNGFTGLRRKFGQLRIDTEYHWENGAPYGTAIPWEELPEDIPNEIEIRRSFDPVCKHCNVPVRWRSNATGTPEGPIPGRWFHLADTLCIDCSPVSHYNKALFDWLKQMEEKYLGPPGWKPEWLDPDYNSEEVD